VGDEEDKDQAGVHIAAPLAQQPAVIERFCSFFELTASNQAAIAGSWTTVKDLIHLEWASTSGKVRNFPFFSEQYQAWVWKKLTEAYPFIKKRDVPLKIIKETVKKNELGLLVNLSEDKQETIRCFIRKGYVGENELEVYEHPLLSLIHGKLLAWIGMDPEEPTKTKIENVFKDLFDRQNSAAIHYYLAQTSSNKKIFNDILINSTTVSKKKRQAAREREALYGGIEKVWAQDPSHRVPVWMDWNLAEKHSADMNILTPIFNEIFREIFREVMNGKNPNALKNYIEASEESFPVLAYVKSLAQQYGLFGYEQDPQDSKDTIRKYKIRF
jgi:hypothetical protein